MKTLYEKIFGNVPYNVPYVEIGAFGKNEKTKNTDQKCDLAYSITKNGLIPTSAYFKDAKVTSDDTSGYRIVRRNWFVYSPSRIDVGSINYLRDQEEVIVMWCLVLTNELFFHSICCIIYNQDRGHGRFSQAVRESRELDVNYYRLRSFLKYWSHCLLLKCKRK